MLASCEVVAFVPTAKPEEAKKFYKDTLGLHLVSEDPGALVFDANGVMLRIAKVGEFTPAPYTVLGWKVENISSFVKQFSTKGILAQRYEGLAQNELGIWTSPGGARVAWFRDPDGNTLSLTEF